MKKILVLFICSLITFNTLAADDLSLIDLFGEEENKQDENSQKKSQETNVQQSKNDKEGELNDQTQTSDSEQNSKISDFFSFLNIPFFRSQDALKQQELSPNKNEPQESYEQRLIKMAESGDVDACLTLGYLYLFGENGIKKDEKQAFKYYSIAAEKNDIIALNNLGSLYYSGIGTKKNITEATKLFEKATQLGNYESGVNLAFIYLTQNSTLDASQRSTIVRLFNQAAEADNIIAQYMMGMVYYNGFGITKNDIKAFNYMQQAAREYDEAQYKLAQMYINAYGTTRNYKKGIDNLIKSAKQGNVKAMILLGDILSEGKNYPKNEYDAYIWYNIASVSNPSEAIEKRDETEKKLKIEEVLQAQAAAETFKPAPSEITTYVRRTFGQNIDKYLTKTKAQNF